MVVWYNPWTISRILCKICCNLFKMTMTTILSSYKRLYKEALYLGSKIYLVYTCCDFLLYFVFSLKNIETVSSVNKNCTRTQSPADPHLFTHSNPKIFFLEFICNTDYVLWVEVKRCIICTGKNSVVSFLRSLHLKSSVWTVRYSYSNKF